jgi:hypothetical protein
VALRNQPRRTASSQHARFSRGGQAQAGQRFARSAQARTPRSFGRTGTQSSGRPTYRRRQQSQPTGAQGLLQRLGSALPLGGSSGQRGKRSGGSLPVIGGLMESLGGKKRTGTARGGKPAMLGLLGAGAAGAAMLAKRRKGSSPSEPAAIDYTAEPPTPAPATNTPRADGPTAGEPLS